MDNEEVIIDVKVEGLAEAIQNLQALKNERKELNKVVLEGGEGQDQAAQKLAATDVAIKQQESALKSLKTAASLTQAENSKLNDSLDGQRAQLSLLKNQYTALTKAERESAAGQELRDKIKGLNDEVKEAEKGFGDFGRNVGNYPTQVTAAIPGFDKLNGMLGGIGSSIQGLATGGAAGFKALGQSALSMGKIFLTPPVGLIVAVLSAIMLVISKVSEAFKKNDEASTRLSKAFAVLKPITEIVSKAFDSLALGIAKLIEGFANGFVWVTKFMESIGLIPEGFSEAANAAQELVQAEDDLEQAERDYTVNSSKRNRDIAKLRNEALDKEKYNASEREAMLKKALDMEAQNLADEKKNAAESLRILEAKAKQEVDTSDETANAIAAARAKLYDAETNYYTGTKRLQNELLTTQAENRKEEEDKRKEAAEKAKKANDERIAEQKRLNDSINALNKALEDKALENIEEGLQRELAARELAGKREIEELKNRAVKTQAERDKIAQLVKISEEQTAKDLQAIRDKNAQEELKRAFDAETERINLVLETAAKGNDDYFNLRVTATERLRDKELENAELTEQERINIITRYENVISGIRSEQEQQSFERQKMAMQNLVNQRLNDLKNSLASEVEVRKYYEQLANDELANIKREQFETEEAYNAAIIASKQKVIDASADVKNAELEQTMTILGSAEQVFGAMGDLIGQFAEDNEKLASFQKAFSLFSIALNTGQAIAAGISGAMTLPFPGNLAAIAGTIATVMANIGSAVSLVKKQKEPKLGSSGGSSSISLSAAASAANTATLSANTASSQNGGSTENAIMAAETAAKSGAASQKVVLDYSEFTTFKTNVEIKESEAKI